MKCFYFKTEEKYLQLNVKDRGVFLFGFNTESKYWITFLRFFFFLPNLI